MVFWLIWLCKVCVFLYLYVYMLACMLMHVPMCVHLHIVDDFAKKKDEKLLCGLKINQNLLLACRAPRMSHI